MPFGPYGGRLIPPAGTEDDSLGQDRTGASPFRIRDSIHLSYEAELSNLCEDSKNRQLTHVEFNLNIQYFKIYLLHSYDRLTDQERQ